jgi:hypothetical protein
VTNFTVKLGFAHKKPLAVLRYLVVWAKSEIEFLSTFTLGLFSFFIGGKDIFLVNSIVNTDVLGSLQSHWVRRVVVIHLHLLFFNESLMCLNQPFLFGLLRVEHSHLLQYFLSQIIFPVNRKGHFLLKNKILSPIRFDHFLDYDEYWVIVPEGLG